jgi:hypothetical protein
MLTRRGSEKRRAPRFRVLVSKEERKSYAVDLGANEMITPRFLAPVAKELDELTRVEFHRRDRQRDDRAARQARIRQAGNTSRRLERERKARLEAETAAILAEPQPQLRKANRHRSG